MSRIAAILLAAGRSQRYREAGGPEVSKLVADFHGEAVVRRSARAALASRASPLIVVTGHAREAVEAALTGLPLSFVHNPDYASGLASSLKTGVRALPPDVDGVMVLLGDMPAVASSAIDALIAAFEARRDAMAVVPKVDGRRGNPVLLSRALFERLGRLEGDEGARALLRELDAAAVVEHVIGDAALTLDVDTPGELSQARAFRPAHDAIG